MPSEVTIRVRTTGPDRGEIKGQIEAATAGQEATIALKTDTQSFAEDIARAKATAEAMTGDSGTIKIRATIDASGTKEELAAIVTEAEAAGATHVTIKGKVEPDDPGGNTFLSWLKGLFGKAESESGGSGKRSGGAFSNAFSSMMQDINFGAGSFRLPVELILPGIQAIGSLTGVLGLVPAAAGLAGASITTFLVGITGLKDTITAYTQAQDATLGKTATLASQQLAASNSLVSASESVANARQAVTDAERNYQTALTNSQQALTAAVKAESDAETAADRNVESAARSLQSAEEQLTSAKQAALTAEQNLTNARLAASRALEDAPNKVIDATLAQKQAVLDLQNASNALFAAPSATGPPANAQALGLAYQQAKQRVDEANLSLERAKEDAAAVTAAGVDGASQVAAAQQQVTSSQQSVRDATQSVGDAQEALVQAQVSGDQQVVDAKRKVIDAQRALVSTEISGDEAITKAKQGVDDALRAQRAAIASVAAQAESGAGSMSVFNAEMARLAPNAQSAIQAVIGLGGTWHALATDVQNHMFAGVGAEIRTVAAADLPMLRAGFDKTADGIGYIVTRFGEWLKQKSTIADFGEMFDNFGAALHATGDLLTPISDVLADLGAAGSAFLPGMIKGWADAASRLADFVAQAKETGQLKKWIQEGVDTLKQLWGILSNIGGIFKDLFTSPGQGGSTFLKTIQDITGVIKWLLDNMPILVPIIEDVFLATRITKFITVLTGLTGPWGLIIAAAVTAALLIIQNWGPISDFFKKIGEAIAGAFQAAWNWLKDNWPLVLAILTGPIGMAVYEIVKNWDAIKNGFWTVIHWIEDRWNDFIGFVGDIGRALWNIGANIWDGLVSGAKTAVNAIIKIFNLAVDGINTIIKGINWVSGSVGIPAIPLVPSLPHWLAAGGPVPSGYAMVGEQGPELVRLPSGSQVMPAANTASVMGGYGQLPPLEVHVHANDTAAAIVNSLRYEIRWRSGGNVQRALGT